jgi:hypothetical protein
VAGQHGGGETGVELQPSARFGRLAGAQICTSARCSSSTRSTSNSIRPPLALRPNKRAGITRVSLNTSRSPGRSSSGNSRNWLVAQCAGHAIQYQ